MAFGACCGGIVDWMAICTRSAPMGGAISIAAAGMIERCVPITGGVTLGAICPVHSNMNGRLSVTVHTGSGKTGIFAAGMTLCAVQVGVSTGQREFGEVVVEGCRCPA